MIRNKNPLPRFKSIEKESDFWGKHSPLDYGRWEEVSYDEILEELKERSQAKQQVSLRLEPELVARLKKEAQRHGIPYQKLARELLWIGISKLSVS